MSCEFTTDSGEPVVLVLVPFVSQRFAVRAEQMLELDAAERRGVCTRAHATPDRRAEPGFGPDTVNLLAAHGFVHGGRLGGGEREAQTIFDYGIEAAHFPANANYVALGHLHRTQRWPPPAPAWYAGSPIQVDFGEEADTKHVLLVDTAPGVPAKVDRARSPPPWTLRTVRGTLDELACSGRARRRRVAPRLRARADPRRPRRRSAGDPPARGRRPGRTARRWRRADSSGKSATPRRGRTPHELFAEYLASEGVEDPRVERLFQQLYDDATVEASA